LTKSGENMLAIQSSECAHGQAIVRLECLRKCENATVQMPKRKWLTEQEKTSKIIRGPVSPEFQGIVTTAQNKNLDATHRLV